MKIAYCRVFLENSLCNYSRKYKGERQKGYIMCESEILEFEDFGFNHYIHHFDECDAEHLQYNDEYECLQVAAELIEEIIWG
jgi:hypothetical protein